MSRVRVLCGVLLWVGGLGLATWWAVGRGTQSFAPPEAVASLVSYAMGQRRTVPLLLSEGCTPLRGDPIFVITGPDQVTQIGEVTSTSAAEDALGSGAILYAAAPSLRDGSRLVYYETPYSMDWVLETMLPETKRREILALLQAAFEEHHREILQALRPVIDDTLRDALEVVRQDLPLAIQRHRPEWDRLWARYQRDAVAEDFVPLVRDEIWPIVRKHAEPLVREVGQEIWHRASLWRFGWRLAYDHSPLPARNLAQKEFERFVEDDATPVLRAHAEDFGRVQRDIFAEVAANERVRAVLRENTAKLIEDPEVQSLVWATVREAVVTNPRLRAVLEKHWRGPQAQQAFQLAGERLDPTVHRIGQVLFGTPETGVTPEFARVLRNRILRKDCRWLVLEAGPESAGRPVTHRGGLSVIWGSTDNTVNPFVRASTTGLLPPEPIPER
jgi:antitoxin component HigA of HigAB toxin-antitoxin module